MRGKILASLLMTLTLTLVTGEPSTANWQNSLTRNSKIFSDTPATLAQRESDNNIQGTWRITEGKNPKGEEYTGTVDIKSISNIDNLYNLSWKTSAGNYSGLGLLENNRLFVGWAPKGETYGLMLYRIRNDGTLDGEWTYSGAKEKVWTETATGGKKDKLEGDYKITGRDSGGEYNGNLTISESDDIYELTWSVENKTYKGVGLRSGDWLVVGWGLTNNFAVLEYEIDGNEANGRWAIPGESDMGVDKITRSSLIK